MSEKTQGRISKTKYWCCKAEFGKHEDDCPNKKPTSASLKQNVSAVLQEALSGLDARGDATRFRDDNGFVRWGMVEQEIHKFIICPPDPRAVIGWMLRQIDDEHGCLTYDCPHSKRNDCIQALYMHFVEANDQISGGTPSSESDCDAGDCTTCGGPVFRREAKPGEYDHECRKHNA